VIGAEEKKNPKYKQSQVIKVNQQLVREKGHVSLDPTIKG
jgi:hypothetical protein